MKYNHKVRYLQSIYSIIFGILLLLFENTEWGLGLQFSYNIWYVKKQIPIHSILYFIFGCVAYGAFPTIIGAFFSTITAIVYYICIRRNETGDGGRLIRKKAKERAKEAAKPRNTHADTSITSHPQLERC